MNKYKYRSDRTFDYQELEEVDSLNLYRGKTIQIFVMKKPLLTQSDQSRNHINAIDPAVSFPFKITNYGQLHPQPLHNKRVIYPANQHLRKQNGFQLSLRAKERLNNCLMILNSKGKKSLQFRNTYKQHETCFPPRNIIKKPNVILIRKPKSQSRSNTSCTVKSDCKVIFLVLISIK
eukprot:TRINITY_DN5397_c0_g1_i8.p2 TRINITY_DN5397_c0_g1~~TRINITY_DN5397_c0_g1_i8.p2  ORF type:complete len:177 (+),score=16.80 TRINITY_DN5397_c0_g1_i8:83-613(+)